MPEDRRSPHDKDGRAPKRERDGWSDKTRTSAEAEPTESAGGRGPRSSAVTSGQWAEPTSIDGASNWGDVTDPDPGQKLVEQTDRTLPPTKDTREPQLLCLAGGAAGRVFPLQEGEATLGRDPENAICLPDPSVSRRHARLRWFAGEWWVTDLKSGHGTLLNGRPVVGEARLANEDILALGDSTLRFAGPDAAPTLPPLSKGVDKALDEPWPRLPKPQFVPAMGPPPARPNAPHALSAASFDENVKTRTLQPRPVRPVTARKATFSGAFQLAQNFGRQLARLPLRSRARRQADVRRRQMLLVFWIALIVSLFLVPLLIRATIHVMNERDLQQVEERRHRADELFARGNELLREHDWSGAKAELLKISELDPSYPIDTFTERADREAENDRLLGEASTALDRGQLKVATDALLRISGDTSMRDRLQGFRARLAEAARLRLGQAEQALAVGDFATSGKILNELTSELPGDADVRRVKDQWLRQQSR